MATKKRLEVRVKLENKGLILVREEQVKYKKKKQIRGKNKIVNILLAELYDLRLVDQQPSVR
jgi:hypothetical protein